MSSFKCTFCSRTFSSRFAYTQYINYCLLFYHFSNSEELDFITDINDMSLESENLFSNVNEVI